jgi:FMN hydrolase / 5-amino-6-(5-phospho-D-ribitylamino)uracil phosphatase
MDPARFPGTAVAACVPMIVANRLRAVAFDLDNTLWDVEPVIARAEAEWLQWLRENCPRITERLSLDDLRRARLALAAREPQRAHDMTWLRIASLEAHAAEFGYDAQIAQRAFDVFFAARNRLDPYADVRPGLARLQSHFRLASLSNGNADLRRIGLDDLFVATLSARSIGAAKPDRRCFEALLGHLQLQPDEVLYVGDDPLLDVAAARAAGLGTAWMNRSAMSWPDEVAEADINVVDCMHLANVLLALSPGRC